MIKNIVFDIGGVILDFKPENFLRKLGYKEKEVEYFTKNIFYGNEWDKYNTALLDVKQMKNELIQHYPEYENDIKNIIDNIDYNYILFENKDTIEYLKELKNEGYNIYILSDASKESYEHNKKLDYFKYINGGVYSFEIHSTKPNKNNYISLLEKFNLVPSETIFIDDRLNNIETAN